MKSNAGAAAVSLLKGSVRAATIADITLSGTQTIDDVVLVVGDRVLVKDQASSPANGIYTVQAGAWLRADDANTPDLLVPCMIVEVREGTTNHDSLWMGTWNSAPVLGTTDLVFSAPSNTGGGGGGGSGDVVGPAGATSGNLPRFANGTGKLLSDSGAAAANVPTTGQKAALAGTTGTPGVGNEYVTTTDTRMVNARTPSAHAASHATGQSDAIAPSAIGALAVANALSELIASGATARSNLGLAAIAASGSGADLTAGSVQATQLGTGAQIESKIRAATAALTAALDINGQNITNVGTVDGVDVSALNAIVAGLQFIATMQAGGGTAVARGNVNVTGSNLGVTLTDSGAVANSMTLALAITEANLRTLAAALTTTIGFNSQRLDSVLDMLLKSEAIPAAPSSTDIILSNSPWAGRNTLIENTAARARPLVPVFGRRCASWRPNFSASTGTGGIASGISITPTGNVSHPALATTSYRTQQYRTSVVAAATTQNTLARLTTTGGGTEAPFWLGNAARLGGFLLTMRFAQVTNTNGDAAFFGVRQGAIVNGTPSTINNHLAMVYDAADANSGNWFFSRRDASTTVKVDLGSSAARNADDVYEMTLYATPNATSLGVRIMNLTSNTVVLETTYSTNLPQTNAFMYPDMFVQVGTGAVACQLDMLGLDAVIGGQ